jgi:hypothetical protein
MQGSPAMKKGKIILSIVSMLMPAHVMAQTTHMLTYDHGGDILWTTDHFADKLHEAISWLDRYPSFKFGLDNEAYAYDHCAASARVTDASMGDLSRRMASEGLGQITRRACPGSLPIVPIFALLLPSTKCSSLPRAG